MHKDEFFMAILLFLYLIMSVLGFGLSMYGVCVAVDIWLRLFCWFGSIVCLVGAILVIWEIKITYFDKE